MGGLLGLCGGSWRLLVGGVCWMRSRGCVPNGEMGLEEWRWVVGFVHSKVCRGFDGMWIRDLTAWYTTKRGSSKFLGQEGIWP